MKDRQFLAWIHQRLVNVHEENENADYMWRLRAIIYDTDPEKTTPQTAWRCIEDIEAIANDASPTTPTLEP